MNQILKFINKFKKYNLKYIPQTIINKKYKGVMSNWFSIEHLQNHHNFLQYRARNIKNRKSEIESSALFMTIEGPDGKYARVRTSTLSLARKLKENNLKKHKFYNF